MQPKEMVFITGGVILSIGCLLGLFAYFRGAGSR